MEATPSVTVLIIDDEEAFVISLTKRLSKRNVVVYSALSGYEGLELLRRHPDVDVVILDVKMPVMNGIQTLEMIKREFPLCEVILLTGHAAIESAVQGMKKGAFDYLMKPCFIEELLGKINAAVEKKRALSRAMESESAGKTPTHAAE